MLSMANDRNYNEITTTNIQNNNKSRLKKTKSKPWLKLKKLHRNQTGIKKNPWFLSEHG